MDNRLTYKTVCDTCYRKTWFETERPCAISYADRCESCGHEIERQIKCKGTLRVIDYSNINKEFAPYLGTNTRVRVKFPCGEVKTGTVGMTSGWKPVLILMARKDSHSSSDILSKDVRQSIDKVTRQQRFNRP